MDERGGGEGEEVNGDFELLSCQFVIRDSNFPLPGVDVNANADQLSSFHLPE